MRPFSIVCVGGALLGCVAPAAQERTAPEAASPSGGRLRPSPALACDRNHLTSYSGVVSGYRRDRDSTWLQISTDEDTVESVAISHPGQTDASVHYRLWSAPFNASDFASIERTPGKLVPGLRAIAWVCDDGKTPPVIDWQPKRD